MTMRNWSGVSDVVDPISGRKKVPTLKDVARDFGWTWRDHDNMTTFTKDGREVTVSWYRNWPLSGVLHESGNHGGMRLSVPEVKEAFMGSVCTCDAEGKSGQDVIPSDECVFVHKRNRDLLAASSQLARRTV